MAYVREIEPILDTDADERPSPEEWAVFIEAAFAPQPLPVYGPSQRPNLTPPRRS